MSAYYGLTDDHILKMPIKRFWLYSDCIDRLQSSNDLRTMNIHAVLNDKESANSLVAKLSDSVGSVVVKDFERDREGIRRLKMMMSK